MEAFDRRHDQVDILVNDARSMFARPFAEITPAEWNEVHSHNVVGTFLFCQEVGKRMVQRQYGRIVNVISGLAERGMINGSAFAASQAAVLSLTRRLAVELGLHNIRVNALGTGWFDVEDLPLEVQQQELLVRYTPLRRKGHPGDIGPLLVYLCSEACDYTTGQPVYVDGGLNAHPWPASGASSAQSSPTDHLNYIQAPAQRRGAGIPHPGRLRPPESPPSALLTG